MFERKRIQILTNTLKHLMFKSNIHINRLIKKIKNKIIHQTDSAQKGPSLMHTCGHARTHIHTPLHLSGSKAEECASGLQLVGGRLNGQTERSECPAVMWSFLCGVRNALRQ